MNNKIKIRLFSIITIIFLCIGNTIKSFQNDTFYMIKLGEYITQNGIDLLDHWCWITNLPYTYPHWLYDVFIYYIFNFFGNLGIYVSVIILFIILILTIYYIQLKINKNEFMALLVSLLSIACLYGLATARAQLVSYPLFLLEVYFIEHLIRTGKKRNILFLTIISLLVANIHATIWPFYFIVYLPFVGQYIIFKISEKRKFKYKIKKDNKLIIENIPHIKYLFLSLILGFIMGVFSPSKICYTYIFKIMMGTSQSYIIEHAPLVLIMNPAFIALLITLLIVLIFSSTKIYLKELLMIGGLIFMTLISVRHLALFYIIGIFYISIICNRYLTNKKDKTLEILSYLIVKNKIIYLLLLLIISIFSYYQFQKNFSKDYIPKSEYPIEAVQFIKNNLELKNLKLYNDYNYGSYLLYNDIPVFIDSRCDLYLSEFNNLDYSIFDDAMEIEYNYEEKFEFYQITHTLISNDSLFYKILFKDQDYTIIYQDKDFTLFERTK